ncbi:MAG: acyl-CoA dehydrogenase family protein [Planctomycetes bacterium]|nr:acyl-CoA dehydrogenase family protein [Planctomycetota bacterium]
MRQVGRDLLRPAGLEAEATGEPLPVDHPLFVSWNRMGLSLGLAQGRRGGGEAAPGQAPSRMARSAILAAEELAFWDQGALLALPGPGLGGPPIQLLGNEDQRRRFLEEPFRDPERPAWGAYATTESAAGSDVARIRTAARRDGDHYVLHGDKMFITNGARASWVVVFATVDASLGRAGHRAFVVERGTPGFGVGRIEKKMGLTASETAGLFLEDCRVPVENLLGGERGEEAKAGFKTAMATFDLTRPMVAAMAVGIGRSAWERARDLAREAFGAAPYAARELGVLDRLATARRRLDAARLLCWRAAWRMDHHERNTVEASMAKVHAPAAALAATSAALDVCGLAGVVDPRVERCYRDVKVFDIFEGTGEVQRIVLARRLFGYPSEG